MAEFTVQNTSDLTTLSGALAGDIATVESNRLTYMKNEDIPPSQPLGWQVPAINIEDAVQLFRQGSYVPGVSVNGFTGTPSNSDVDNPPNGADPRDEAVYQFYGASGPTSEIQVNIDGKNYSVSSMKFASAHNQIPTVLMTIDGKIADQGNIPSTPRRPTLAELNEVRSELMKFIYNDSVTVSLNFTVRSNNDEQVIDIKEWIIAGVGTTSINARGTYSVSVLASHSLVLADSVHTTLFNSKNIQEPAEYDGAANLHLKTVNAIERYLELTEDTEIFEQTDNPVLDFSALSGRVARATSVLKDKMEWKNRGGTDLPLFPNITADVGEDITEYFDDMLWRIVLSSSSGNHSPMNIIKVFTQPDRGYGVGIDGGFSDLPVVLSPQVFWGTPTCTVYDDEIVDLLLPGESSYPLAGVICPYPMQSSNDGYGYYPDSQASEKVDSVGAYIKPAEMGEVGPIYRDYLPAWISGYPNYTANNRTNIYEVDRNSTYYNAPDSVDDVDQYWVGFESMSSAWARNRFLELYGSGKRCTMQLRLMLTNPNFDTFNNQVRSGENVCVRSRETDEVMFYFYILQVEHIIDAQRSTAYTNIVGAYVRPPGGIPAAEITESDITDGLENILYGAKGGLRT